VTDTPRAAITPKPIWSWAWLAPIAAIVVVIVLAVQASQERGPAIEITFRDAAGLDAGDSLRHRGIVVGTIERVRLDDSLANVLVRVRLRPEARGLAVQGSKFWIVRPELSLQQVSGLDTLLSSNYIAVAPGAGEPMRRFAGLDTAPSGPGEGSLVIRLLAERRGSLTVGSPVFYRDIRVGAVRAINLARDSRHVELDAAIEKRYAPLVRDNSEFWNASGISAEFGLLGGLTLRTDSLETVITGGISFATPTAPGNTVVDGHEFELSADPDKAWLRWEPAIELD